MPKRPAYLQARRDGTRTTRARQRTIDRRAARKLRGKAVR